MAASHTERKAAEESVGWRISLRHLPYDLATRCAAREKVNPGAASQAPLSRALCADTSLREIADPTNPGLRQPAFGENGGSKRRGADPGGGLPRLHDSKRKFLSRKLGKTRSAPLRERWATRKFKIVQSLRHPPSGSWCATRHLYHGLIVRKKYAISFLTRLQNGYGPPTT